MAEPQVISRSPTSSAHRPPGRVRTMPSITPAAVAPRTKWEANRLFCGAGIIDEGAGFLDHVAGKTACHDLYDSWLLNLETDWHGGD